jgi:hypothetical protein
MQVVDIFSSYSTIALPGHLGIASGLPFSRPSELQSLVQPVRVHRNPPSTLVLLHASLVDSHAGHPCTPPVCHPPPPPFPSAPSTETATVEVVLEKIVQPSAPSTSESPSRPEIFIVR